jgi:hypothetical protein
MGRVQVVEHLPSKYEVLTSNQYCQNKNKNCSTSVIIRKIKP